MAETKCQVKGLSQQRRHFGFPGFRRVFSIGLTVDVTTELAENDWELGNLHPTIFEEWGPVTYQIQRNLVTTSVLPDSVCHSVWSQRPHHA